MPTARKKRETVDGLELPLPNKETIAHAIISTMEGWKKAAEIITQVPSDITRNFQSVRAVICELANDGYLMLEHAPHSRGVRGDQRYALTEAGHKVRDYINSLGQPAAGGNRQYSGPTTSG